MAGLPSPDLEILQKHTGLPDLDGNSKTNAVGRILGIPPGTVRIHRCKTCAKRKIRSQVELFLKFIQTILTRSARVQ